MHRRARRAGAVGESGVAPAAAPSPPEWTRGARPRGGHGGPHGRPPRVPDVAMEVSSLGGATRARERIFRRESPSGLGPLHRRFIGCDVASAHRGRPKGV